MLTSLYIRHIALIDEMTVPFSPGLNVLTGETGAGKSIIVDAMALLLGGRADKSLIRDGQQRALVEGIFDLRDCESAAAFLRELDIASDGDENELVLSREITLTGRSACRVNGVTLPAQQYQQLTSLLMDLHGQHAHQSLMDDKNHVTLLDAFGDESHLKLVQDVSHAYRTWSESHRYYQELVEKNRLKQDREDVLKLQRKELKNARLVRGEEEELQKERDMFRNSEKISSSLETAYDALYDGANSAIGSLQNAMNALQKLSDLGEPFSDMASRAEEMYYECEDLGLLCSQKLDECGADPERQEEVLARLDLIKKLSRRHGATTHEMLDKLERIEDELRQLQNLDADLQDAERDEEKKREVLKNVCVKLTKSRKSVAAAFEKAVESQLNDLNMAGTRFVTEFTACEPTHQGAEQVLFLIAPNRGEKLQSLSKPASGGELSRLMLAIKAAAAEKSLIPSMIFDEIDTGISGRAAQVVADKLYAIAKTHQVLCVTHLQQIAAAASHQYLVEKTFDGSRTVSSLRPLTLDERVHEIARMLGGDPETAMQHAKEMLSAHA